MRFIGFILSVLFYSSVHAEVLLNCGSGALRLGNGFRKIELQILSVNGDFTGKAGKSWFYRFSPTQDWMQEDRSVAFMNSYSELVFAIAPSEDLTRPGFEYVISDPQAQRSTMDQYYSGESAARVPIKTFICKRIFVSQQELGTF
jgi:hypothetical protein